LSSKKNQKDPIDENVATNDTIILTKLQQQAEKVCGVRMSLDLINGLVAEFGEEKVDEKINMLGCVETKNAPGFLIDALRNDYILQPGRPQQQKRASPGCQAVRKNTKTKTRGPDTAESLDRKKMIQSLYMSWKNREIISSQATHGLWPRH